VDEADAIRLTDPDIVPDAGVLEAVLGASHPAYLGLLEMLRANGLTHEWRFYRDGGAWLCKVSSKKGTIVWMSARTGFVRATVYVPERLLEEVSASGIGTETIERIGTARSVGKSRPCTVDVREPRDVSELERLVRFKLTLR